MMSWQSGTDYNVQNTNDSSLVLGGDGRCDSPGHTAKYGSYSLMDLDRCQIMDIQLVQSNDVKSSMHMELEGLKRGMRSLDEKGCTISTLVTDRHVQLNKFMREEKKDIAHLFDVWHIAKGVSKKLKAASKKKDCTDLQSWVKSVSNHIYWVAATTGTDENLKEEKWRSIVNHVCNIHEWEGKVFTACEHGELDDRKSLKEGSKPYTLFKEIALRTLLVKDLKKLSLLHQTYSLEVFHSVLNHFAPKSTHFFYPAMKARILVAAMHFNENSKKTQAVTKEGDERWAISYPKAKNSEEAVAKPVMNKPTFRYVNLLLETFLEFRRIFPSYREAESGLSDLFPIAPKPLTSAFKPIDKEALVKSRKSRFSK